MSSYSTYTGGASSFDRSGRFERERSEYPNTAKEEQNRSGKHAVKKQRSKQDTWKGIFVVTQFWVICFASVAFLAVATASLAKLSDRQILETKDRVPQLHTWFKVAICFRPFMTDTYLKTLFEAKFNKNFEEHIKSLNISDEEKNPFFEDFYLDNTLEPKLYQSYFRHVHPWKDVSPNVLWEAQKYILQVAFAEFLIDGIPMGKPKLDVNVGMTENDMKIYAWLPSPQKTNATGDQPPLVGELILSPIYLGCAIFTLNKEMAKKQVFFSVKFRPAFSMVTTGKAVDLGHVIVSRYKAADVFVLNKDEPFTEISTIKQNAKFSVDAFSRERLLVKKSMFIRQRSKKRNCEVSETNSEMACRKHCVYKGLLDEINCTLPWMERFREEPQLLAQFASLPKCSDLDPTMMLEASTAQEAFMSNIKIRQKLKVQSCLQNCLESCHSSRVRILSLGSKSIGTNYGISLTISPIVDVVKEHFNYNFTNMVSELCASVSFLLGLSAIAIYDWLVAFGVWLAVRLGLRKPDEAEAEGAKEDATVAETTAEQGADPAAAAAGPAAQTTETGDSADGVQKRRVSVQLPGETTGNAAGSAV
ncbi:uncharacterized protein LOC122375720 isoform X2 [Amphibalanus amphitrite]|uniref:uncharacterized protein LOC122375720 isoform X2 n=1 Tax=Amphibalanus amphitrite TaxID=1232801 RepID=UPI001C9232A1|nr:uncharacterized protein LOC122375720 isoform X2 [Amphibalanus amphitrite]